MNNAESKYYIDGFIATLILVLPFFIYGHLLFSSYESELILFNYSFSHWLENNETFIWFILNDFVPLSLLLLMFFTTLKKWKYFLIPLLASYFLELLHTFDIFSSVKESIFSSKAIFFSVFFISILISFDHYVARLYRRMSIYANLKALISRNYKLDLPLIKSKLNCLHDERERTSLEHYLKKLYNLHFILNNYVKSINLSSDSSRKDGIRNVDKVCILLIIFITFVWYSHLFIPDGLSKMTVGGFTIEKNGFIDLRAFTWFVSHKFIVILFLSLWFITSEHWWKYAILSPLVIFSYQFYEAFQDVSQLDAFGNIKVFPLVFLNVLLVVAISKWVKYRTDLQLIYESIYKEVENLLEELKDRDLDELKKKYKEIKDHYRDKDVGYYRSELESLEHELWLRLTLKEH